MAKIKKDEIEKILSTFEKQPTNVPLEVFYNNKYKALISTVLSSRTKDETTLKACKRLFQRAPDFRSLYKLREKQIRELISPVGFYKTKANHLKKLSKMVIDEYEGKIPSERTELMKLPGVGRKTANLVLNRVFNKPAIAVDTHVHKISNLLGWVNTNKPEETERALMKVVPKRHWSKINRLFVSVGRNHNSKRKLKKFLESKDLI